MRPPGSSRAGAETGGPRRAALPHATAAGASHQGLAQARVHARHHLRARQGPPRTRSGRSSGSAPSRLRRRRHRTQLNAHALVPMGLAHGPGHPPRPRPRRHQAAPIRARAGAQAAAGQVGGPRAVQPAGQALQHHRTSQRAPGCRRRRRRRRPTPLAPGTNQPSQTQACCHRVQPAHERACSRRHAPPEHLRTP